MDDEPSMTENGWKPSADGAPKRVLKPWAPPKVISSEFVQTANGGKRPADGTNVGTKASGTAPIS